MSSVGNSAGVVVLCPMRIERDAVARALREHASHALAHVVQTGIGKDAILRVLTRELEAAQCPCTGVVLAGVCGGLAATHDVPGIARIIDTHAHAWTPTLGHEPAGVTLVGVDRVIDTPEEKRSLAMSTGASIVDMESHALAAFCESRGLRWGVVRGVSDTPDETLPSEVLGWVTPEGETRTMRAAMDLARTPRLVPHVFGVLRRSKRVLPQVGQRALELVREASQ